MAKKYKSSKLAKQPVAAQQKTVSAFGKLANRLADSKKKKIEKLTDTQKRLLESKKNNKMIKVSKKAKKFALLDEDDPSGQGAQGLGLTHRGINVRDLKEFDDVNFNESDLENDEDFENLQEKMNFAGFEATDNLLQQKDASQQNRPKSQNEIYKQIIQKSKAYKMVRQQQYEQNLNMATELDKGFESLVSQLKFRNKDQQLLQRIEHRDLEYDRLMNELKEDERVVSNKVVEKSEKVTERIRKKKNEQLNKLMRDSEGEEDIRGWVDGEAESEDIGENEGEEEEDEELDGEEDGNEEEGSYDELDEVDLSSEEEEEGNDEDEQEGDEEQVDAEQGQNSQEEVGQGEDDSQEDHDENEDQDSNQDQDSDEQQDESSSPVAPPKKGQKPQPQVSKAPQPIQSRQAPQKKVKLNFIQ